MSHGSFDYSRLVTTSQLFLDLVIFKVGEKQSEVKRRAGALANAQITGQPREATYLAEMWKVSERHWKTFGLAA